MQVDAQVLYLSRWVDRASFREFVYNSEGQKLCNSYDEFSEAISSGIWAAEPHVGNADNVVTIRQKRGRKCQNLNKA